MIDENDLLNFFIPGLDAGFIIIVVILIIFVGFHKFFKNDERKKSTEIKEPSPTSNNSSSSSTLLETSIFEWKDGNIIAEAFPLDLFLSEDSKYISFTTPVSKPKVVDTRLNRGNDNKSKFIVQANVKPFNPLDLLGVQSPEGFLCTTYNGKSINIDCFLKDITIEKLRQQKDNFVVCESKDLSVRYTLKYKWDVIKSQFL